jgi:uncharacterized protein YjbI with pentapeptide repeats
MDMEPSYIEDRDFDKTDFTMQPLPAGHYDNCRFSGCNFSGTDLSGFRFAECTFSACNISMVKLHKTALQDIRFTSCKLLGLHFEHCDTFLFSASFDQCTLQFSSFYQMKLKHTRFNKTDLREVDFTQADLSGVTLAHCDLHQAVFDQTILEKADLRTALHYSIDPENNRIKKARFSLPGVLGLLHKYDIRIED